MINTNPTNISLNDTADVYAQFEPSKHKHVEVALFYEGKDLLEGKITLSEFTKSVEANEDAEREMRDLAENTDAIFAGVSELLNRGDIKSDRFQSELREQIGQGRESLLHKFIMCQSLKSPLDAAVSFLAWNHTRALFDLEEAHGVQLDRFRNLREPDYFGTSESQLTLLSFSTSPSNAETVANQ